jgi:hypothetical protein
MSSRTIPLLDRSELPDPAQTRVWKAMSPARKYELCQSAIRFTRNLKRSGIRAAHPAWSEAQVESELAKVWLHARS